MLFRRISQHVKDQNWTAIWIDFLIVVVGVFVGLQVSNWNETSRGAEKEAVILEQLHSEFTAAIEETRAAKIHTDESRKASFDVLRIIRDGEEPADKAAFLQTLR